MGVMVTPVARLDLALIQRVLFGGRFSPLYLLPFQVLQYAQARLQDYDNALIGFLARVRAPWGLGLSATLLVDDFAHNARNIARARAVRSGRPGGRGPVAFRQGCLHPRGGVRYSCT